MSFSTMSHDIDLAAVLPSPELAAALAALPGRKFIFTNGSRRHAEAVTERLGVTGQFEDICDIHALDYIYPKPMPEAYRALRQRARRRRRPGRDVRRSAA